MNLSMLNPQDVLTALMHKQWLLPSAVAIGLIIRLLKSDTKIPLTIPPAARSWAALILGAAAGVIDKAIRDGSTTWTVSLLQGVGTGVFAMVMHTLLIASLRDGKEIPIPGLTIPGASPSPGKPPSIPSPALPAETPVDLVAIAESVNDPLKTGDVTLGEPPSADVTLPELPSQVDSIPPPASPPLASPAPPPLASPAAETKYLRDSK